MENKSSLKSTITVSLTNYLDAGAIVAGASGLTLWQEYLNLTEGNLGWLNAISANCLGAAIGAIIGGFLADKYDVTDAESVERANERIKKSTEEEFRKTVTGYSTVTTENTYINLQNAQAKYALYPVWMLNTQWNGKKYTFAMNGQTGKMVGDLPCDNKKYWLLTIAFIAGLAAVCFGLSFLIEIFANIFVSAIIAIGGGFLITGIMRGQLKSVGFKSNATDYVRKGSFKVTERNDFFMYKKVDRREKPKQNN